MTISSPYTLIQRTLKSGKKVYYYRIRLPNGKRSSAFSTGETSKIKANNIVRDLWKAGRLIPGTCPTLFEYTQKWFIYDECAYIQSKLKAGQSHSRTNAKNQRYWLETMILPYLGKQKLDSITPKDCERWLNTVQTDKGHAINSIRNYAKTLSVIFGEAVRLGDLKKNPMTAVRLPVAKVEWGIPTKTEVKELLNRVNWPDNLHYAINVLAHGTGMRLGEIQALKVANINKTHIEVVHSWDRNYGLKSTKSGKSRTVPISPKIYTMLLELKLELGISEGFLFSLDGGKSPIWNTSIVKYLQAAYQKIGIERNKQKERKLSFHSWRHLFVSDVRGNISEIDLQKIVGHVDSETTNNYDHEKTTKNSFITNRQEAV